MRSRVFCRWLFVFLSAWLVCLPGWALTPAQAKAMAIGETDARIEALNQAVAQADEKTAAFIQALADDAVKIAGDQVFIIKDAQAINPVSGQAQALPEGAEDVINNNRMRGELDTALAALKLFSADAALRRAAVAVLLKEPSEARLPLLDKALASETDAGIKAQLELARAAAGLGSAEPATRLAAAQALASSQTPQNAWGPCSRA
jgi:urea transport system permease protein